MFQTCVCFVFFIYFVCFSFLFYLLSFLLKRLIVVTDSISRVPTFKRNIFQMLARSIFGTYNQQNCIVFYWYFYAESKTVVKKLTYKTFQKNVCLLSEFL